MRHIFGLHKFHFILCTASKYFLQKVKIFCFTNVTLWIIIGDKWPISTAYCMKIVFCPESFLCVLRPIKSCQIKLTFFSFGRKVKTTPLKIVFFLKTKSIFWGGGRPRLLGLQNILRQELYTKLEQSSFPSLPCISLHTKKLEYWEFLFLSPPPPKPKKCSQRIFFYSPQTEKMIQKGGQPFLFFEIFTAEFSNFLLTKKCFFVAKKGLNSEVKISKNEKSDKKILARTDGKISERIRMSERKCLFEKRFWLLRKCYTEVFIFTANRNEHREMRCDTHSFRISCQSLLKRTLTLKGRCKFLKEYFCLIYAYQNVFGLFRTNLQFTKLFGDFKITGWRKYFFYSPKLKKTHKKKGNFFSQNYFSRTKIF